ncbi:S-adenosyl-L-methionine-dependent methyltransferases superfamily protein [Tanacetum coccineum]
MLQATKLTDNDANITGAEVSDCHILMNVYFLTDFNITCPIRLEIPIIRSMFLVKQIALQPLMRMTFESSDQANPEGLIAEGYVAEEALTFSSHYFWDVTTKFNRLDRNVTLPSPRRAVSGVTIVYFLTKTCKKNSPTSLGRSHVDNDQDPSRDELRTTQNSDICLPGPDGEMYYGQLQEIIEFKYLLFKVALFRVKWFDTSNK